MKKIALLLIFCLTLSACGTAAEVPAATPAPEVTEQSEAGPVTVVPLTQTIDAVNGTLHISLKEGDVYVNDKNLPEMKVTIHAYELYDAVAMSALKVGDSIIRLGEDITVNSLEQAENGDLIVNGGLDVGGHVFRPGDGGTYYEISYNDAKCFNVVGEAFLPLADSFSFTDGSDLDSEPQTYYLDDFFVEGRFGWYFFPSNTTIRLENGVAVSMERVYIP